MAIPGLDTDRSGGPRSPAGEGRPGGGPGGGRGPAKLNPADRKQLNQHPVSLRRIAALFAPHKGTIAVVVLLISASSMVNLAQPFLVRGVIDNALPQQNIRLLALLTASMVAVAAVTAAIGVVQTWMATSMGQRVMHTLRVDLFTHLQAQSLGFFTRTRGGEVQSRLTHDISGMQSVVTTTATGVASNLTTAVATAVAMVALSPGLSLISLVVLPPAIWLSRRVAKIRREVTDERQRELAALHTQVEEGLSVSGVRLAKTLGTIPRDAARFRDRSDKLVGLELRSQLAGRWRMATMQIVFAAIPAVIYLAAGFPATSGGMTIGTLVAFTGLQGAIFRPVMGLLNIGVQWVTALAFFSRIFEYLDLVPQIRPAANPVRLDPAAVRGEVRFEDVRFAYDDGADVLRNINMILPAGTATAVVGATGSGKSTLASLLPRLNDTSSGTVLIDGVDVREIAPEDLARIVGVVSQESYLIHASVRENLLLADPDAGDEQLWSALAAARMADTVGALPEGLDTMVGARGHRFSGGEQQRLAIARTILRNPPVLVLDEATSALDNTTEAQVQAALEHLSAGRTTLTIAHRLSTVENADQVVVLDAGRIVERGTPAELRAADGAFARLAAHSAAR
ncbi:MULTISPECIES: ABC transporter ATP-binding protein [unclassified Arthrobacter]|uniref:ABC transporter ATP-binding protein n=1 Tax=unclassified Arthrobacter TaxID=235627 RepID=UPI001D1546B0|nr:MULTISPECIES: ABC transporter ATP-binding protein [unclassified Arthrobacter]MCC3275438.1 ABC transporter ATP-binding protein/permease [Arthrobacter sp. zg-Y20]MCC9176879.1 ABC transporter ATP-binding protein/permease [Arthrobacter sp. zg-Y750]MDK1315595.1 ABC transporter ATP-binding protein [Arthrobacter sp. zg.Y20]WIB06010.1 ABC transporter ATP-binding protein [Arthrobacter sp. zg-Y20]